MACNINVKIRTNEIGLWHASGTIDCVQVSVTAASCRAVIIALADFIVKEGYGGEDGYD